MTLKPGDVVYYAGDEMGARADVRDVGTLGPARPDGMMPVRWASGPQAGWWVRPDGTGRHEGGAVFTVQPAPFRGGAGLMGGWQ